jgi:hypothetical protein
MLNVEYNEEVFELRNEPNEIKLFEFEKIYNILNQQGLGKLEQYFQVFKTLGMPDEILEVLDAESFVGIIKEFNAMKISNDSPVKSFEIKGHTYTAYDGEEFKFNARDLVEIEKAAQRGVPNFPSYVLAVVFKNELLTNAEHRDKAHIEYKAKVFAQELTADVVIPYITRIAKRTLTALENE